MTHASTTKAQRREADRLRKQRERAERKAAGAPAPHQVDLAVTEAFSFVLNGAYPAGAYRIEKSAGISINDVVTVAIKILVKRWRFDKVQAAKALLARIAHRPEHFNPTWYPHFPSCELKFWSDMSSADFDNTCVTPTGHVQDASEEVTQR